MLEDLARIRNSPLKELSRVEYDLDHGGWTEAMKMFCRISCCRDSYRKSLDVHGIRGRTWKIWSGMSKKQQKRAGRGVDQKKREDKKRAEETRSKMKWR